MPMGIGDELTVIPRPLRLIRVPGLLIVRIGSLADVPAEPGEDVIPEGAACGLGHSGLDAASRYWLWGTNLLEFPVIISGSLKIVADPVALKDIEIGKPTKANEDEGMPVGVY